ncbi:MAG: hypothetical protein FWG42_03505 [Clostridiales bacterium]|nr:hypothetical protein [Clostridiales bacterium]
MKSIVPTKKLVLIIVVVFALAAAVAAVLFLTKPPQPDALRFSKEYLLMSDDNVFVYKNAKETADFLESGTGIVFMGFPTCPWCQAYVVLLDGVAKELGVEEIFYLDIFDDRSDNSRQYQRLVAFKEHHLLPDDDGNPRIFVPDVTVVKDGVVVGHDNETSTMSDMDPSDYWTMPKVDALQQRLREMMELIQ